jgi:hypothetical protein
MWKRVRKLGGLAEKVWKRMVEMKREDFFFALSVWVARKCRKINLKMKVLFFI